MNPKRKASHLLGLNPKLTKGLLVLIPLLLCASPLPATQVRQYPIECVICGEESSQNFVISTNMAFGPDLDLRPSMGDRSINYAYVQHCPHCGYCAYTISDALCDSLEQIKAALKNDEYLSTLADSLFPEYARYFFSRALIEEGCGKYANAGWSLMRAVWECDDYAYEEGATRCRRKAVELFKKAMAESDTFATPAGAEEAVLADILRRSGDFEAALRMCDAGLKKQSDRTLKAILKFQKKLARRKDTYPYTLDEVNGTSPSEVIGERGGQIILY